MEGDLDGTGHTSDQVILVLVNGVMLGPGRVEVVVLKEVVRAHAHHDHGAPYDLLRRLLPREFAQMDLVMQEILQLLTRR